MKNKRTGFNKKMQEEFETTNSSVFKKISRFLLSCRFCPPNAGENSIRRAKYGAKKPKYKDKYAK